MDEPGAHRGELSEFNRALSQESASPVVPLKRHYMNVTKDEILQVHSDSVITSRTKFLDVTDGDLVAYCKELFADASMQDVTSGSINLSLIHI